MARRGAPKAPEMGKLEKVHVTHDETGDEMTLFARRKRRLPHPYDRWLAVDQGRLAEIAANRTLTPLALRLIMVIMADSDPGNTLYLSQKDAAEWLGYRRQQISTAWRQLREAGILEEGIPFQGRPTWALAPEVAWRGPVDLLITALRTRAKNRLTAMRAKAPPPPPPPQDTDFNAV
jgi:hypothetical protein